MGRVCCGVSHHRVGLSYRVWSSPSIVLGVYCVGVVNAAKGNADRAGGLLHRLQEQGVGKDGDWGSILRRPLFAGASDGGSASLAHLVSLFVERHHTMWKVRGIHAPAERMLWIVMHSSPYADAYLQ